MKHTSTAYLLSIRFKYLWRKCQNPAKILESISCWPKRAGKECMLFRKLPKPLPSTSTTGTVPFQMTQSTLTFDNYHTILLSLRLINCVTLIFINVSQPKELAISSNISSTISPNSLGQCGRLVFSTQFFKKSICSLVCKLQLLIIFSILPAYCSNSCYENFQSVGSICFTVGTSMPYLLVNQLCSDQLSQLWAIGLFFFLSNALFLWLFGFSSRKKQTGQAKKSWGSFNLSAMFFLREINLNKCSMFLWCSQFQCWTSLLQEGFFFLINSDEAQC